MRIALSFPDRDERKEILAIHLQEKPLSPEVDLEWLADRTEGWNGARIEALCRQAALTWFREGVEEGWPEDRTFLLTRAHFERLIDHP